MYLTNEGLQGHSPSCQFKGEQLYFISVGDVPFCFLFHTKFRMAFPTAVTFYIVLPLQLVLLIPAAHVLYLCPLPLNPVSFPLHPLRTLHGHKDTRQQLCLFIPGRGTISLKCVQEYFFLVKKNLTFSLFFFFAKLGQNVLFLFSFVFNFTFFATMFCLFCIGLG